MTYDFLDWMVYVLNFISIHWGRWTQPPQLWEQFGNSTHSMASHRANHKVKSDIRHVDEWKTMCHLSRHPRTVSRKGFVTPTNFICSHSKHLKEVWNFGRNLIWVWSQCCVVWYHLACYSVVLYPVRKCIFQWYLSNLCTHLLYFGVVFLLQNLIIFIYSLLNSCGEGFCAFHYHDCVLTLQFTHVFHLSIFLCVISMTSRYILNVSFIRHPGRSIECRSFHWVHLKLSANINDFVLSYSKSHPVKIMTQYRVCKTSLSEEVMA